MIDSAEKDMYDVVKAFTRSGKLDATPETLDQSMAQEGLHPAQHQGDSLTPKQWDGVAKIGNALHKLFGVDKTITGEKVKQVSDQSAHRRWGK